MIKAKHLIDKIASRKILEQAADDALDALDDKEVWYAKKFIAKREERIDRIQNMIILGIYPHKKYKPVKHLENGKMRDIFPLDFDPWSILFHAVKIVIEPIINRILIFDTSAGIEDKGQVFAALRTKRAIRRYKKLTHFSQSDLKKFYVSIPHDVILDSLRYCIDDELFIDLIICTMLDYYDTKIDDILQAEHERKMEYCKWASDVLYPRRGKRGIIIGSCISQLIGNLVLCHIDRIMTEKHKVKGYHRHCDDTIMLGDSIYRTNYLLNVLDGECNKLGLCIKASSYVSVLKDEEKDIDGRALDYVGYVFSRKNMRIRKRNKVKFSRAMSRVKSRKRKYKLVSSFYGIAKWGKGTNLLNTILINNNMSFRDFGIKTEEILRDRNGKRIFDIPETKPSEVIRMNNGEIVVYDFEEGIRIKDKDNKCCVVFRYMNDGESVRRKFIHSSSRIIDKLMMAREKEKKGVKVFPQPTRLTEVRLCNGRYTYDIE